MKPYLIQFALMLLASMLAPWLTRKISAMKCRVRHWNRLRTSESYRRLWDKA